MLTGQPSHGLPLPNRGKVLVDPTWVRDLVLQPRLLSLWMLGATRSRGDFGFGGTLGPDHAPSGDILTGSLGCVWSQSLSCKVFLEKHGKNKGKDEKSNEILVERKQKKRRKVDK